jgi:hypothetical protein
MPERVHSSKRPIGFERRVEKKDTSKESERILSW